MKTTLYYFSGTGNSLKVAKDIADKMGDTEIISIPDIIDNDIIPSTNRIGFIFPVYAYGLPLIVAKFIKKLANLESSTYIFTVVTCKTEKGGAIFQVTNELKNNGLKLSAAFSVKMPGNYIYSYKLESIEEQEEKFKQWISKLYGIVSVIKNREIIIEQTTFFERTYQYKFIYSIASQSFNKWDQRFWSDNNCNGCGICQKVCPVRNICLKDKKPVWMHQCEQCFACVNWCPKNSIQCNNRTIGRKRYHNPEIKLKDILREG